MQLSHTTPGPPPARDQASAAVAAMRLRRSSLPLNSSSSYRNLQAAETAPRSENTREADGPIIPASPTPVSHSGAQLRQLKVPEPRATAHSAVMTRKSTRQGSLFSSQEKKREQSEYSDVVASLQQNGVTLAALNQREKAHNEQLKAQVEQLLAELNKVKEAYEEEKVKNEKITALRKQKLLAGGGEYPGYLPDIHASPAAAAAALQQQAQLEISYQRRILSLENRSKDLIENNKRLLNKIQQLEKTEADAGAEIDSLRLENTRLATQADSLSSTVISQSSLIIGLRTTVQKLNQEEQNVNSLVKKFERCQIDLEAIRTREKLLREEHEKLKLVMSKEKEMLMSKILEFQRKLQLSDQAGDTAKSFMNQIRFLELEKQALSTEIGALNGKCEQMEARMHQQEEMTNRFLHEKQQVESARDQFLGDLASKDQELLVQQALIEKFSTLSARGQELDAILLHKQHEFDVALLMKYKEVDELMQKTIDQDRVIDELHQSIAKREAETRSLRFEVQSYKQLSQDDTVQALQLARLKAANHEALTLLEEEKRLLQDRIDALTSQLEQLQQSSQDAKVAFEASLAAKETRIQDLLEETRALHEKAAEPVVVEVEKLVAAEPVVDPLEKARLEADMNRLQGDYEDLKENFLNVEGEYKKLVTKKYKTESFQSQVRLLQNENSELASKLERVCNELARERADLSTRTRENLELRERVMEPQAIELLRKTQESLEKTVSSLVEAETSSESSFTCLQCMRLFVEPMTLAPCGHTYCASCLATFGNVDMPSSIKCKDCLSGSTSSTSKPRVGMEPDAVFPNQALADLTARFIFRQQSLSSLTTMCLSLRNSFANRSTVAL